MSVLSGSGLVERSGYGGVVHVVMTSTFIFRGSRFSGGSVSTTGGAVSLFDQMGGARRTRVVTAILCSCSRLSGGGIGDRIFSGRVCSFIAA